MFIAIAILLSYLIAFIIAGHGGAPMAVLLFIGDLDSWFLPGAVAGWVGIVGLISATFLFRADPLKQLTYQFFASIILYLSWLALAILGNDESGSLWSSFVMSAPFQITFFIVAYRFMVRRREQKSAETGSTS